MNITKKQYTLGFNPHKAAQSAAFFLHKANNSLDVLKLVKLMYLAERESLLQSSVPLTGDYLLSMPHGPVLSQVLDQINGGGSLGNQKIWDGWINSRAKHKVALDSKKNKPNLADSLLSLSESDLEVLQHVWDTYGAMTQWKLRDFTHTKAIPEWQEPHGSSIPICYETLFEKNGKTKNEAKAIARRLREEAAAAHSITT